MFEFLSRLTGGKSASALPGTPKRDPARYEREKKTAESGDAAQRLSLAADARTHQEILFYLAEKDSDPRVRAAAAANRSTPLQANAVIVLDRSEDVRLALAGRLVNLLPDVSQEKYSHIYAHVVQALAALALDEVLKVRLALSSTLKDHAQAPPKVVAQLARDIEREVAEPILRFCITLPDEDMLDILKSHPASWTIQAIAARPGVSETVSRAVIESDDRPAGAILIGNEGAQLSRDLLEDIVSRARSLPEWQLPIAGRKNLPPELAREMASYVDASVRDVLLRRGDFDSETAEEISAIFRRRLEFAGEDADSPDQRVQELEREGRLNEDAISDALALRDSAFVQAALARMLKTDPALVARVFGMRAPKPLVALCWRAGLPMRLALQMQKELVQIPHKELIYPRGGTDYPLSADDMKWQLEFLGLEKAG